MSEEFALAGRKISRITRSLGETASFDSLWARFRFSCVRFSCVLSCSLGVSCSFFGGELVSVVVSGARGFLSERCSCSHPSASREWRVRQGEENERKQRKQQSYTPNNYKTHITTHSIPHNYRHPQTHPSINPKSLIPPLPLIIHHYSSTTNSPTINPLELTTNTINHSKPSQTPRNPDNAPSPTQRTPNDARSSANRTPRNTPRWARTSSRSTAT